IVTASNMKLEEEIIGPCRPASPRAKGPLFNFLSEGNVHNSSNKVTQAKLASTKKGIENRLTNSLMEIRPMAITKLQGARPKYSCVDEWLSGDIREDVIGAIEQGARSEEHTSELQSRI